MAKIYVDTVKYEVQMTFSVDGVVDKHDVVGAIFGQSEGLLGEDLDLKELQKNGKLGRIEITTKAKDGKTMGNIVIPSSLDMAQTCILAAGIETVDKVGPFNSKFKTKTINDTRTEKRKQVKDRAKELLKTMIHDKIPESSEIAEEVRARYKKSDLKEFGKDKVPAGPEVDSSNEIIVVEGRADVLNLLKHGIKNVIAIDGSNIPQTIIDLSKRKSLTFFGDGDRGGKLNARKMQTLAKVNAFAFAPDGKEVEELTSKEILQALRRKSTDLEGTRFIRTITERRSMPSRGRTEYRPRTNQRRYGGGYQRRGGYGRAPIVEPNPKELEPFKEKLEKLKGSMKAHLLDAKGKKIADVKVRDLIETLSKKKKVHTILMDGIITNRLAEAADKNNVSNIVGIKKRKLDRNIKVKVAAFD